MTPVSPVVPGLDLPEVLIAKDQPEYIPLPAYVNDAGDVYTRWELSEEEKRKVAETGSLWLMVRTFNSHLQPVMLTVDCPLRLADEGVRLDG